MSASTFTRFRTTSPVSMHNTLQHHIETFPQKTFILVLATASTNMKYNIFLSPFPFLFPFLHSQSNSFHPILASCSFWKPSNLVKAATQLSKSVVLVVPLKNRILSSKYGSSTCTDVEVIYSKSWNKSNVSFGTYFVVQNFEFMDNLGSLRV